MRRDEGGFRMLDQMPRRTNFFQAVVAIIHGHMAGDAVVEESAMLTHALTGAKREVDVVIRTNVAGYAVIVSVEATATGRRATGPWVEQMCAKHAGLPTNQLVLVSEKGFTPEALRLAAANHAVALSPADLDVPDPDAAVVGQLKSLWPKILALTPESASVQVERPDGGSNWVRALFDNGNRSMQFRRIRLSPEERPSRRSLAAGGTPHNGVTLSRSGEDRWIACNQRVACRSTLRVRSPAWL